MPDRQLANLFLEQSNDLIWIIDSSFCLKYANQAYQNVMKQVTSAEKKMDELIFTEGFGDGYIEKWKAYYERGLKGEHFEIEEHFYNPNTNQVEYSKISFKPIAAENGIIVNLACQSRDITNQKVADKKLAESESFLSEAQRLAKMGNWNFDFRTDKLTWSDELYNVFDTDNKTFLETHGSFIHLIDEIDRPLVLNTSKHSQETGESFNIQYRITTAKGENRIIEEFGYGEKDKDGKIVRLFGTAQNITERRKNEIALQQSEARLKGLIASQTNYVLRTDLQGNYTYCNQKFKDEFGWLHGDDNVELIGANCLVSIMPYHHQDVQDVVEKCFANPNKVFQIEIDKPAKNNAVKTTFWDFILLTDSEGRPDEVQCSGIDISERIKAEQDTKEANRRFELINEATFDTIWDYDLIKKTLYWGAGFKLIFGYNIVGLQSDASSWTENIHPEDFQRIVDSFSKATKGSDDKWFDEYRFRKSDLTYCDVLVKALIVRDEDGNALRMLGAIQDITKKKAEEHHLKLLESVITNTNDAVLITEAEPFDEPGPRILYVNEAFTRMTGYTAEEVIGKSPRILQGPKSDKAELARLSKALRNWESSEITTINYKKNGEEFWINFSLTPVADETGWYTHWISIDRDVTEKKKLEITKDLTSKISAVFNVEPDLSSALSKLCEEVDVVGQFSFCEIWLTDVQESLLELKAIHKYDESANIFYENSKLDTAFERGQGVPGKIWEYNQSIIWEHKGKNQELLFRSAAAEKAGIKTIVGFPLMYHDNFIGVLQFGTHAIAKNVEWIINVLEELGAFIGAEIARKKTEIEITKIFEFAPDIIATCGFDGFFKTANPYINKLLGYTEKEFTSKPLTDFLHPDDAQKTIAQIDKLTTGTPIYNFKNRYFTKTGEIKTISWNFSPSVEDGLIFCIGKDVTEEVKIGRLLKESNQLSRIGSWELDLINNSIFWSDITHEIHETPENFKPQLSEAISFYREDFRELATQAVFTCIEKGTPFDFEAILLTIKKNEVWVRAMGRAELVDGKCVRIFGSFQDIHQRKESQLELLKAKELAEENEQKMKQAQKLAHIGSWYYDVVNQVSQWSEETYNIWGLNQDITSVDFVDHQKLIHPKDWERFNSVIKNAIKKGIPYKMDLELVRPDGSYKTVNTIGDPIFDEVNKVIAFKGTTQDISDRIIIENELRSAIEKAEKSLKSLEDYKYSLDQSAIIAFTDNKGIITSVNDNFCKISKYEREEIIGKTHRLINSKHHPKEFFKDLWKTIASGEVWRGEIKNKTKDGSYYWVDTTIVPFLDEINNPLQYLAIRFDITERKKAEQEKNSLLTTLEKSLNEIYVFDAETLKFSYVNQGALIHLGYSEQEIKALTPLDLKPDYTKTSFNQLIAPLISNEKEKIIFFTNHKRKDGSLYPVEVHLQFVVEGNNKRFLAVVLDITNLKETEQLLDSASKLARVGSWELVLQDNEEFKMFWSSMTKNILEIDESFEPTSADGINVYKEPSRTLIAAAVNTAIETGEAFDLELELLSGKGNDIWIRCIGDAQFENGKVTRVYGSFQDINTRKLAELNQLKLIEEKSKILESIGDAFYALDGELNFTYMNSSCANLLAVKKEKIIGKNLFTEFPDLKNTLFEEELRKVQNTAEATKFEFYYAPFDAWFEESIYPTPTGISVYFVDITQRKIANAEIAKSEEKRRLIMNGALDVIISIDTNEKITFWNPQAEVIFGWKAEEVMGKALSETIIPEPFRKYHIEGLKNYLKTGEGKALNVLLELSAIRRNREEFPIELTVIPIKQGSEEFFCAFIRDITQRKKSERELIENENYLRTILDNEPECVKVLNSKGELLSMNPAGLAMIEADNEQQVLGQRMTDLVNKEYQLGFNRLSKEVFKGNSGSFEFEITGLKGGCRWLETHAVPLKDTTGKIVNLLGVTRDITERKKAEIELLAINKKLSIQSKELQRSNEELEQFAFITSHDLQEPLRMISSFMDQLKRKYADRLDEKGLQYIHFATDGAKRMKQIILDLLLYSRANKPMEQNELINLNEIVSEYSQLRRKVIAEKSAIITFHGLPSIETYRAPITQIFHSLLDNALKYVDANKPPSIEITAIEKENVWQFAIKDNGIGIDQKFFDKIFIIFQRLQNRKEHDGTGIGLAIAKRSVEYLGGEIWVESEIDKGSTFYFTLFKIKQLI